MRERKNLKMKMINFVETKGGYQEKLKSLRMLTKRNVKFTKYRTNEINDKSRSIKVHKISVFYAN